MSGNSPFGHVGEKARKQQEEEEKKQRKEEERKSREEEKERREQISDKNSDLSIINLNSGVKELIKLDLTTEEGIWKAINLLDFPNPELELKMTEVALQAQRVQRFMEMAKDAENKLRFSLVKLLISSRL